jgi:hypothetical protein
MAHGPHPHPSKFEGQRLFGSFAQLNRLPSGGRKRLGRHLHRPHVGIRGRMERFRQPDGRIAGSLQQVPLAAARQGIEKIAVASELFVGGDPIQSRWASRHQSGRDLRLGLEAHLLRANEVRLRLDGVVSKSGPPGHLGGFHHLNSLNRVQIGPEIGNPTDRRG